MNEETATTLAVQMGRVEEKMDAVGRDVKELKVSVSGLISDISEVKQEQAVMRQWRSIIDDWKADLKPQKGRGIAVAALIVSSIVGLSGIVFGVISSIS